MGRRRQVSDQQISLAAREVFLDRGPKAPVAMVAKKLGVSTATLSLIEHSVTNATRRGRVLAT